MGVGGLFWACFGLGRADFPLAQGGVGLARGGFWECGFGVWGGIGWDRLGSRGGGSGFWTWWVALGHGAFRLGVWGLFWSWRRWFWVCAEWLGLGVMGFGDVVVGIWGRAVWVRGLVGHVLGIGGLCRGMGDWDLGLEGGIWVCVGMFWVLAASWMEAATKIDIRHHRQKKLNSPKRTHARKQKPATQTQKHTSISPNTSFN